MKIERLNKENSKSILQEWRSNDHELNKLSTEYKIIRDNIKKYYEESKALISEGDNREKYIIDVQMAASIYSYLKTQSWFNLRLASDDDFWRYMSVVVVPDIVADRWGENNETYFWKQSNRIWLKTIWWYFYLTWQGNVEATTRLLKLPTFNSDIIQALVERTGRNGTYVDVYRYIVLFYSEIKMNDLVKYKKRSSSKSDTFFRAVMKLNTARCQVINPCLCPGGEKEYAKSLISAIHNSII